VTDFYENRFNELESFLDELEDQLYELDRKELEPVARQVTMLIQLSEDDPLAAAKLTPKLLTELPKLKGGGKQARELTGYRALKEEIVSFVEFELPLWTWRPQLKAAAFDVLAAAWILSAGGEFEVDTHVDLEDRHDDFLHTTDGDNDKLQLFIEAIELYNANVDKKQSSDRVKRFELALERFTVAALVEEIG